MFELYASSQYGHVELAETMYNLGLRTKRGRRVGKSTFAWILANPFYTGLIRLKATGQVFEGRHAALISQTLFRAVREVSGQRINRRVIKHNFSFRRLVRCGVCGFNLVGERVKGIVYYRCHTKGCPPNAIRDDRLSVAVLEVLAPLEIAANERRFVMNALESITSEEHKQREDVLSSLQASRGSIEERMGRLADAFLEGILDRELLQAKQKALIEERKKIDERIELVQRRHDLMSQSLKEFVDFASNVRSVFEASAPGVRQQLLRRIAIRISVTNKVTDIVLHKSYKLFAARRPPVQPQTRSGVSPAEPGTLNSSSHDKDTIVTGEIPSVRSSAFTNDQYGCPLQVAPRRSAKELLLQIGHVLITGDD